MLRRVERERRKERKRRKVDMTENEDDIWCSSRKWESGWTTEWKKAVLENYDAHYIMFFTRQTQSF